MLRIFPNTVSLTLTTCKYILLRLINRRDRSHAVLSIRVQLGSLTDQIHVGCDQKQNIVLGHTRCNINGITGYAVLIQIAGLL